MSGLNPYKVLGIRRDSGAKRIKKAFREAAKRAHPDLGGSVEDFHLVRRAYFILSDPERREKYDRTGQVDEITALAFETHVAGAMITLFEQFVTSGKTFKRDFDVIDAMMSAAVAKTQQLGEVRGENEALIKPLAALKGRILRREGENIFGICLQRRIDQLHEHSARVDEQITVLKAVCSELRGYDCVTEMVRHHHIFGFTATNATGVGGLHS